MSQTAGTRRCSRIQAKRAESSDGSDMAEMDRAGKGNVKQTGGLRLSCVRDAIDLVLDEIAKAADEGRASWEGFGKKLAVDLVVRVPIFLSLQITAHLHDAIEVESCAAQDAAEVLVSAAGFVLERVVNDRPVFVRRRQACSRLSSGAMRFISVNCSGRAQRQ